MKVVKIVSGGYTMNYTRVMGQLRYYVLAVLLCVTNIISVGCASANGQETAAATEREADVGEPGTMPRDRNTFVALTVQHKLITREVIMLENGIETLTQSADPGVAALIKEHVLAMKDRIESGNGFRFWDPLFAEIFEQGKHINFEVEETPSGIRVVQTSDDPMVVKLIQEHAGSVDKFVAHGNSIIAEPHPLPEGYNRAKVGPPN